MTTTKIQAGTVSHGTLRTCDLIEALAEELGRHSVYTNAPLLREVTLWRDRSNLNDDHARELLNELFDALNDIAPEGMYFGAHEGDGSDFGFWYIDNFADYPSEEEQAIITELERPGGCGAARYTVIYNCPATGSEEDSTHETLEAAREAADVLPGKPVFWKEQQVGVVESAWVEAIEELERPWYDTSAELSAPKRKVADPTAAHELAR